MPTTGSYLLIGAVACLVTFVATPLVRRLAEHFGWLYLPSERTVHTRPMPGVGGLAMFVGFIVAFAASRLLDTFDHALRPQLRAARHRPGGDDHRSPSGCSTTSRAISAPAKVTARCVAGIALVYFGVTMFYFRIPFVDRRRCSPTTGSR